MVPLRVEPPIWGLQGFTEVYLCSSFGSLLTGGSLWEAIT